MRFIRQDLERHFIMALKSNRTVALSEEDKKQGRLHGLIHCTGPNTHRYTAGLRAWIFPFYSTVKFLQTKRVASA